MSVTWLHISDLHASEGDPYDRNVVLKALLNAVAEYRERGHAADIIFVTGDIANSGKPAEYQIAEEFLDKLLAAARLPKDRLFVIPGNHDVDRQLAVGLGRTLTSGEEADRYFRPELPKPHLTQKLRAFREWHDRYFEGIRTAPRHSTCGPVEMLTINGRRLGILPLNSALFCEGNDDHDKLFIGRRCLDQGLAELSLSGSEVNIVLVHHPLEWLCSIEGAHIQSKLESSAHILLRGHLHETRVESVASADGQLFRCAAGAAYQTRHFPNRALYGTLDGGSVSIFPICYLESPREVWTTDSSVFPREDGHEKSFPIPGLICGAAAVHSPSGRTPPPRFRSNIETRGNLPFVGRDDLIARMTTILSDLEQDKVVVLHGQAGVGKSELAREYARLHRHRYTGGTFWVDASTDAMAIHLAAIGKHILSLDFPSDLPLNDQGIQTFHALGFSPVLLLYDNVVAMDRISTWLPLAGMPCHVIVTTLRDSCDPAWNCLEVLPLSAAHSVELATKLIGDPSASKYVTAISDQAGGLPVQIVPVARTVRQELRRGQTRSGRRPLAPGASQSFYTVYSRLDAPAQLLLHAAAFLNPQRIPMTELAKHMEAGAGWSKGSLSRALETCSDLHLLAGRPDPSLHQLFASFIRDTAMDGDEEELLLAAIRRVQKLRLLALANLLVQNPADTESAALLISYPVTAEAWILAGEMLTVDEGCILGHALFGIGRFQEARPWFERAVAKAEKADLHGQIDHASLSKSLHQVGDCLSSMRLFEEAQEWFMRAVAEAEKRDRRGRIDHASLGRSLHQVGYCLSSLRRFEEARPWFLRAVTEAEKGDIRHRIDHASLGSSLHEEGYCLARTGRFEEALEWFVRAVKEIEKGDDDERVDHASLGGSLHQLGDCLASLGRFEEAQPLFERAITEAEKGDVHGRVDHESLGVALHHLGHCLARVNRFSEARPYFERAAQEAEKGDIHGRIDHQGLAITLRAGAACLQKLGEAGESLAWEQKALDMTLKT